MEINKDRLITEAELEKYKAGEDLADKARALLTQQIDNWDLPKKGFGDLDSVEVKEFDFDGFKIKVQFNPGRITSSAAKVDPKSIKERKCFLCPVNLPEAQKGIQFGEDYLILVNPFPIFPEHFTIPKLAHTDQLIKDNIDDLLNFSKALGKRYVIFYNGPKCGASAPDHMHYQAGLKGFMPIDNEYESIIKEKSEAIYDNGKLKIYSVANYLRNFISIESEDKLEILNAFNIYYELVDKVTDSEIEPMMNIIGSYENGTYRVILFPRENHRPSQYFAEGEENILLSPASVDMGGVCITPLEKDFNKISKEDLTDIFRQVSISREKFEYINKGLKEAFNK